MARPRTTHPALLHSIIMNKRQVRKKRIVVHPGKKILQHTLLCGFQLNIFSCIMAHSPGLYQLYKINSQSCREFHIRGKVPFRAKFAGGNERECDYEPGLFRTHRSFCCSSESTLISPETIVLTRIKMIETDGHSRKTCILQAKGIFFGQVKPRCGDPEIRIPF